MDLSVMYAILGLVAVVLGVIARFSVYTILVRFNRWLPEKATKAANISAIAVTALGLLALAVGWLTSGGTQ